MAVNPIYKLPEGNYSLNFIRSLAMAGHLGLVEPSELTFMLESGKNKDLIGSELLKRVVVNKNKR